MTWAIYARIVMTWVVSSRHVVTGVNQGSSMAEDFIREAHTCSTMSRKTSFFLYLRVSLRHPTAPVTCTSHGPFRIETKGMKDYIFWDWFDEKPGRNTGLPNMETLQPSHATAGMYELHSLLLDCST